MTKGRSIFQAESDFYLLCNPWHDDDVFSIKSNDEINEFVLNEHGQIFLGSSDAPRPIPWFFGQFESSVLLTALSMLDSNDNENLSEMILEKLCSKIRADPGMKNAIFDSSPSAQLKESIDSSSPVILKYFLRKNRRTCSESRNWQQVALLCSLCRSLGIPSRVVTIYNAICGPETYRANNSIVVDSKQTRFEFSSSFSSENPFILDYFQTFLFVARMLDETWSNFVVENFRSNVHPNKQT